MVYSECNENGVAKVVLNRPEKRNAFNAELLQAFTNEMIAFEANPSVKVVIIEGEGEHFSAGADLGWMRESRHFTEEENRQDALILAKCLQVVYECKKPTIAVVRGACYGGAVGLVACCDIALSDTTAKFCLSEVKLGLIPAVISPFILKAMGTRTATRLTLTAELIPGILAKEIGLIHEIHSPNLLETVLQEKIKNILQNAPIAMQNAKQLFREASTHRVTDARMTHLAETIAAIRVMPEAEEGLSAFLDKRKPNYQ